MTRIEKSRFEEELFVRCYYEEDIYNLITSIKSHYEKIYRILKHPKAKFGIDYCDILLNSKGKKLSYTEIMELTGDKSITRYFSYRTDILNTLYSELKKREA